MKAIDTNILIRFLTRDDERQSQIVYKRFKQAEIEKEILFIPLPVTIETIWVLESAYNETRKNIYEAFKDLLAMPILKFEKPEAIQGFILSAQESKIDLSDILIAYSSKFSGCELVITFDKKASKHQLFELIK